MFIQKVALKGIIGILAVLQMKLAGISNCLGFMFAAVILCQVPVPFSLLAQPAHDSPDRQVIIGLVTKAQSALAAPEKAPERLSYREEALTLYQKASFRADSAGDYLASAAIFNLTGILYDNEGNYQRALGFFENGMKILETQSTGNSGTLIAHALNSLSLAEKGYQAGAGNPLVTDLNRGEIEDFQTFISRETFLCQTELAVLLMTNAGNMYLQQSQFQQADSLYRRAFQIARQARLKSRQQQLSANMAWSLIKNNRLDEAKTLLDSVILSRPDAEVSYELRRAFLARGTAFREQKMYSAAISDIDKALELYKNAHDDRGYCRALAHLASAYFEAGDLPQARVYYLEALERNASINDKEASWHANGGLAKCYLALGDYQRALAHFGVYWETVRGLGSNFTTDQGKVSFLENQSQLLEAYARAALYVSVEKNDFGIASPIIEKLRGSSLASLRASRKYMKPPVAGELPANYVWFQAMSPPGTTGPGQISPGIPGFNPNRDFNPVSQMAPGVATNQYAPGIPSLPEVPAPDQESSGLSLYPEATEDVKAEDSVELQRITFLTYFVIDDQVAILIKSPEKGIRGAVVSVTADSLDTLITQYRYALRVQKPRGMEIARNAIVLSGESDPLNFRPAAQISKQLNKLLIAPVKEYLPRDPQQMVVIIPHRSLWLIPFAALLDEQNRYFGDQHVLTYSSSYTDWALMATQSRTADFRNLHAWVVGNPQMPPWATACNLSFSFYPLQGAQTEAEAIAGLFGAGKAELFTGSNADRLRLEAWHSDFDVLHFATHGYACMEDPLSSFIVLSQLESTDLEWDPTTQLLSLPADRRFTVKLDTTGGNLVFLPPAVEMPMPAFPGILDARTIINRFYLKADLVTLSACQTGVGKLLGQGTIGFTRAFLAAGARSLLVSLWQVNDKSTEELMITFYQEYLRHGNKAVALKKAMQTTRQWFPDPKDWAAFTLIGLAE